MRAPGTSDRSSSCCRAGCPTGQEVVIHRDNGLFPQPGEIKRACDCPDWATMCKHVAAVLYGVGSRLEKSPDLLFRLRGVDEAELIAAEMALPRGTAAADTLADGDLGDIFCIDLDPEQGVPAPSTRKPAANTSHRQASRPKRKTRPVWLIERWRDRRAHRPTARTVGVLGRRGRRVAPLLRGDVRRWEARRGPLDLRARPREALIALRREIERQGD